MANFYTVDLDDVGLDDGGFEDDTGYDYSAAGNADFASSDAAAVAAAAAADAEELASAQQQAEKALAEARVVLMRPPKG